jgi:hypothetical protein
MDFTIKGGNSTPIFTAQIAEQVCILIRTYGNADLAFKNQGDSGIDYTHFNLTNDECNRIVAEITQHMTGSKLITPEVYGEDGILISPAIYYIPSTQEDLLSQISSDYLQVSQLLEYHMQGKSWEDYKNSFVIIGE